MIRSLQRALPLLLLSILNACTEEVPTEIGGPLVPSANVQTFEVLLEPSQYLVIDTAFSGYTNAFNSPLLLVANNFESVLSANTIVRFNPKPASVQVRDSTGTVRTDTLARYSTGDLVIVVDTSASVGTGTVAVYRTAESFHAPTTTWTLRFDTSGVRAPWTTPGGTRGPRVGTAAYTGARDSVFIPLDSATIFALTNPADSTRGAMITLENISGAAGARLRINPPRLRLNARSTAFRDTTVVVNVDVTTSTYVYTPEPPRTTTLLRVSGVPAWRAIVGLRDDFGSISVACPGLGCTVNLRDAHINLAELLLQPTASPPGFSPEDSIAVEVRALLSGSGVPLERSPLSEAVSASLTPIARDRFTATNTTTAPLIITSIISALATDTASVGSPNRAPRQLALLTNPESATFGFGTFRSGPKLRLVLTTTTGPR